MSGLKTADVLSTETEPGGVATRARLDFRCTRLSLPIKAYPVSALTAIAMAIACGVALSRGPEMGVRRHRDNCLKRKTVKSEKSGRRSGPIAPFRNRTSEFGRDDARITTDGERRRDRGALPPAPPPAFYIHFTFALMHRENGMWFRLTMPMG